MSNKYTYQDVIIDPDDPRVKIEAEYYFSDFPGDCLYLANSEEAGPFDFGTLEKIDKELVSPFSLKGGKFFCCMIRKKASEGKYIPFDLTRKEIRDKLRGRWIRHKFQGHELCINAFFGDKVKSDMFTIMAFDAKQLFNEWEFLDGSPCGELEEV